MYIIVFLLINISNRNIDIVKYSYFTIAEPSKVISFIYKFIYRNDYIAIGNRECDN